MQVIGAAKTVPVAVLTVEETEKFNVKILPVRGALRQLTCFIVVVVPVSFVHILNVVVEIAEPPFVMSAPFVVVAMEGIAKVTVPVAELIEDTPVIVPVAPLKEET